MDQKIDLSKLPIDAQKNVFLGSLISTDGNDRHSYGFMFESGSIINIKTVRTELIFNHSILQLIALSEVLRIIEEFSQRFSDSDILFNIYFNNPDSLGYLVKSIPLPDDVPSRKIISDLSLDIYRLERSGIKIEYIYDESISINLWKALEEANNGFKIRDDFQGESYLLSSISSKFLDDSLNDHLLTVKSDRKLIQYINKFSKGVPGALKRVITITDESVMNDVLSSLKVSVKFPTGNDKVNSFFRRTALIVRDSDACLLFSSCMGQEAFIHPETYYYALANLFEKKIFIFDTDFKIWLRKSVSTKRELVKVKRFDLSDYKNVSYFCTPNLSSVAYNQLMKLV